MATTEELMPIQNIRDDVIIAKDGTMSVVLQTSSINFGLLSENEQLAIISSFAGFLNSLSFVIQIVIRSRKLDISQYITRLDEAQKTQTNPLLSTMMNHYRNFIRDTIKENEVLDKQFYVVASVSYLEAGISRNIEDNFDKAITILVPRRDHVLRQMARMGLKAVQLNTSELVSLFYDIYNETPSPVDSFFTANPASVPKPATAPKTAALPTVGTAPTPPLTLPLEENQTEVPSPISLIPRPEKPAFPPSSAATSAASSPPKSRNLPFIVEELGDDYGTI